MGIKTAMLTGDSKAAAMFSQNQLEHGLDMVHAELLPEDKVSIVRDLKLKEGTTAMVGDGMNDAPALSAADVGISMGISGSAIAMETSHITLMSNDIRKIPGAIRLGRATRRKIVENIILSVATKAAILALAFAGHPLLWAAILADVGTCILVILNSMLLLKANHEDEGRCCKAHAHGSNGAHHHCPKACTSSEFTNQVEANGTSECCSDSTGSCGARKHAKESREVLAAAQYRHERACSTSLASCVCHVSHDRSHARDHANDHSHNHGPVQNQCHSHDNIHPHDFAESRTNLGDNARQDSHLISITSGDGDAGHNKDSCNTQTPSKCAAHKQNYRGQCCSLEEEKVVLDICTHRKDEVEFLRHIEREKRYSCSAAYHSHQVCPELLQGLLLERRPE